MKVWSKQWRHPVAIRDSHFGEDVFDRRTLADACCRGWESWVGRPASQTTSLQSGLLMLEYRGRLVKVNRCFVAVKLDRTDPYKYK